MQRTQGKLIVTHGKGLVKAPKQVTYVAKKKYKKNPRVKAEWKSLDSSFTLDMDTTGVVRLINNCTRGDDINNREGREINLRSLEFRAVDKVTAGTGIDQNHRVMFVLDKMPSAAAPAITDILESASIVAPRNLNNRKRFKIIMDKLIQLNASGEPGSAKILKKYKQLRYQTQFNASDTGTISDIMSGALYLVMFGDKASGTTAGSIQGYVRIRFTE